MDHLYNKRVAYHTGCIPVFWFAIAKKGEEEDTSLPLSFKRCAYWDMGKAVAE
jgi:hypothetical protein